MTISYPRYMSIQQALKYLNIKSRNTLNNYIANGLKVTIVGGTKRIDRVDADIFMEQHKR